MSSKKYLNFSDVVYVIEWIAWFVTYNKYMKRTGFV